jgi:hypothetical protein
VKATAGQTETTTMTDDDLQPLVAATYAALADLLDAMPAERWDTPSLCEGWHVREVVAHLTMPARYSQEAFMAELRQDGFDFKVRERLAPDATGRDRPLADVQRAVCGRTHGGSAAHPHCVGGHHLTGSPTRAPVDVRYSAPSCVAGARVRLAAAPLVLLSSPLRHRTCVRYPPGVSVLA